MRVCAPRSRARVQNNGQSCIAAKRFIVAEAVADEFLARFTTAMDSLQVGDPFDPATDVGPIVTRSPARGADRAGGDARAQGATVHAGGAVYRMAAAGTSRRRCSRA